MGHQLKLSPQVWKLQLTEAGDTNTPHRTRILTWDVLGWVVFCFWGGFFEPVLILAIKTLLLINFGVQKHGHKKKHFYLGRKNSGLIAMTTGITDGVLENKTLACLLRAMIFKQTFSCLWSGIQSMDFVGSDPLMILGCRFQRFLALMRGPSHYSPRASWHFLLFLHQSCSSFYFTRIDPLN